MYKLFLLLFLMVPKSFYGMNTLFSWNGQISSRNYTNFVELQSACSNGQQSTNYAFSCPHMMLLSDDMIMASKLDGLDENFLYAVAGSSTDKDCGICYQVQLLDAEREWKPNFKQLIVQIYNSGYDVMSGQLDIFMGGGGFGYFDACNIDCNKRYCQGGPCHDSFYQSSFEHWNQAQYDDPNVCYSGGIKWLDQKDQFQLKNLCQDLVANQNTLKDRITVDSCFRSNVELLHQNFVSTNYLQVKCPESLTKVTGLFRKDYDNYPHVHINNRLESQCKGDRTQGHYCVTTMQDCCKPSCSWSNKGNPDPIWNRIDSCSKDGNILENKN